MRVQPDSALATCVCDLRHDDLRSSIGTFWTQTEYIAETEREGGRRELN